MAQFFEDFSGFPVGTDFPAGWTKRWTDPGRWSVVESGADKAVRYSAPDPGFSFLAAETYGAAADVDVLQLADVEHDVAGTQVGAVLRGSLAENTGYFLSVFNLSLSSRGVIISRMDNGSESNLTAGGGGIVVPSGTRIWVRCQAIGDTLRAKYWLEGDAEPGSWMASVTDTAYSSGYVGIFGRGASNDSVTNDSFQLGLGTGGDLAPASPASSGSGAPTNLQTTQVTSTSARLSWDAPA